MKLDDACLATFERSELTDSRPIAAGTTSTICVATLDTLEVVVKTLKELSKIEEPLTRERASKDFENELVINAQLRHPNVVQLIGCIRTKEVHSLVFEYSKSGVPKCSDYGLSRLADAINICLGVGRALCYAHRLGIVHRDVKPSQILMFREVPKLGDWGLATKVPESGCKSGETGTWEFMAPEVIRCEPYFESADVYSFGILLCCYVMGNSYPYADKYLTPAQAAMGVSKKGLRPQVGSRVPDYVTTVIKCCWEADPNSRPKMTEVLEMLERGRSMTASTARDSRSNSWWSWFLG